MTTTNNTTENTSIIVTFYSNTRYAGGRSHRNINTLEFVEGKDIMEAAEHYGYNIYPIQGDDFESGINDASGNELMDEEDYAKFTESEIGRLDFGDTVFYSCQLKDIDVNEFRTLPLANQLQYINIWCAEVSEEMLTFAKSRYSIEDAFDFDEKQWQVVKEELEHEQSEDNN